MLGEFSSLKQSHAPIQTFSRDHPAVRKCRCRRRGESRSGSKGKVTVVIQAREDRKGGLDLFGIVEVVRRVTSQVGFADGTVFICGWNR